MKALIVGYGRMGREIEAVLKDRDHEIIGRVDPAPGVGDFEAVTPEILKDADFVIEFALPGGLKRNIELYAQAGVPAVIGTTGWDDKREEYAALVKENNGCLLWGSNFSVGAHVFFKLAEEAAALIDPFEEYDIFLDEFHHRFKKDSPSGTALTAAEKVLAASSRKTKIVTETLDRQIEPEELHVGSVRGGSVIGIHGVYADSPADTIEIRHTARNRSGFARGSVLAAEWLRGKTGFYRVEDFIEDMFQRRER